MILKTDELGLPRFTDRNLIDMIYKGHADKMHVVLCEETPDVDLFNQALKDQGLPELNKYVPLEVDQEYFDKICQSEWLMPDEYKISDKKLFHTIMGYARNEDESVRLFDEYVEYERLRLLDLLKFLIYLVDFMRENSIVWGVGRGSSVSSYILYKIGIHRVDSLKYDLDYHEFLR